MANVALPDELALANVSGLASHLHVSSGSASWLLCFSLQVSSQNHSSTLNVSLSMS